MRKSIAALLFVSLLFLPNGELPALSRTTQKTTACETPKPLEEIRGTVDAVSGRYGIEVRDADGITNDVEMTPNTIVKPAGVRVKWGMRVRVLGRTLGCVFIAQKIVITAYP